MDGMAGLLRRIDSLKSGVQKRVTRAMVRAGCKVVTKRAKELAPKDTGLLKKSIGQKVKIRKKSATALGIVGPRKGQGKLMIRPARKKAENVDPVRYGHFPEAKKPYLRPARDGMRAPIVTAMSEAARKEFAKL